MSSTAPADPALPPTTATPAPRATPAKQPPPPGTGDADGMAVASFLLGLPGLLVMNLLLGPAAIVLALVALSRGTRRPGRAVLGLALGVAAVGVQVALTLAGHGVLWSFT